MIDNFVFFVGWYFVNYLSFKVDRAYALFCVNLKINSTNMHSFVKILCIKLVLCVVFVLILELWPLAKQHGNNPDQKNLGL